MLTDFDVYVCRICKGYPLEFTAIPETKSSWWARCTICGFVSQAPYGDDEKEDNAKCMGFFRPEPAVKWAKADAWKLIAAIKRAGPAVEALSFSRENNLLDYQHLKTDKSVQTVVARHILERLWDVVGFLKKMNDYFLSPGGRLWVLTPLIEGVPMTEQSVFRRTHLSLFTLDAIHRAGSKAGFALFEVEPKFIGEFALMKFTKNDN